jgi:hypothetical protein
MASMNSCLSRVTAIDARRYYADQKHKFFLEMRCDRPCADQICADCLEKSPTSIIQWCRKVDHGLVSDPIPDRSHIFGGAWYEAGVLKWGAPSADAIRDSIEYQTKARALSAPLSASLSASKVPSPSPPMEAKRGRKPKLAPSEPKEKRPQKPVPDLMVQKEVVLPTHMENTREIVDTDGYEIEYVKLSLFTIGDLTYFRDSKKNKLYKRIKDKIGGYVGRYDPRTESIHADVPDSDDEQI